MHFFKKKMNDVLFSTLVKNCVISRSALFFVNSNVREEYFIHAILIHAAKNDIFSSTKKTWAAVICVSMLST